MESLVGSGTLVVVVGALMKLVKSAWKPDIRELYIIPAFAFSGLGVWGIMYFTTGFEMIPWFILSLMVTFSEGFVENDFFNKAKKIINSDETQDIFNDLLEDKRIAKEQEKKNAK